MGIKFTGRTGFTNVAPQEAGKGTRIAKRTRGRSGEARNASFLAMLTRAGSVLVVERSRGAQVAADSARRNDEFANGAGTTARLASLAGVFANGAWRARQGSQRVRIESRVTRGTAVGTGLIVRPRLTRGASRGSGIGLIAC